MGLDLSGPEPRLRNSGNTFCLPFYLDVKLASKYLLGQQAHFGSRVERDDNPSMLR